MTRIRLALIGLAIALYITVSGQDFSGQVFVQTENFSNNGCLPVIECDCCTSEIIFTSNAGFVMVDRCVHEDVFFKGTYDVSKEHLTLTFNQYIVREIYDEKIEKSELKKQNLRVDPIKFFISKCGRDGTILQRTDLKVLTKAFRLPIEQQDKIKKQLRDSNVSELLR